MVDHFLNRHINSVDSLIIRKIVANASRFKDFSNIELMNDALAFFQCSLSSIKWMKPLFYFQVKNYYFIYILIFNRII